MCWALRSNCVRVKQRFAVSIEYPNLYSFVCLFLGEALPTTSHPRRKGLGKSERNSSSIARCNHSETSFIHMKLLSLLLPDPLCHQRIKILPIFSNCIEKNQCSKSIRILLILKSSFRLYTCVELQTRN